MLRTIGEIVDEDVGVDGVHLGLNKAQIEKCTLHSARSKRWVMTQSAMPSFMKSRVNDRPSHFIKVMIVFCCCYDRSNYYYKIYIFTIQLLRQCIFSCRFLSDISVLQRPSTFQNNVLQNGIRVTHLQLTNS